jgi:hypothetical protein
MEVDNFLWRQQYKALATGCNFSPLVQMLPGTFTVCDSEYAFFCMGHLITRTDCYEAVEPVNSPRGKSNSQNNSKKKNREFILLRQRFALSSVGLTGSTASPQMFSHNLGYTENAP